MQRELSFAHRARHAVGVILLDLDRFKQLNDTFGHAVGDSTLKAVADVLQSRLRVCDVACRFGGEEMVVIVPGAQTAAAITLAEQLRLDIEQLIVSHDREDAGPGPRVTASFGVASFPCHGLEPGTILRAADAALYRAKAEGRNRVVGAPLRDAP
jgi:diguanylate cyclase (GGDEF)-like protein